MSLAEKIEPLLQIVAVQPQHMRPLWPHLSGYFKSFEERSDGSILAFDLYSQCVSGERQCWIASDGNVVKACALTEIQKGPMNVVMLTFCAGEDMIEWRREMVDTIKAWAKTVGSGRVIAIHRIGWTPFLKDEGFKVTHYFSEFKP